MFSKTRTKNTASLDRIDNKIGYEVGNVHWVHKEVNMAKGSMSHGDFLSLCRCVYKKYEHDSEKL
jgi:hypothetical protein